MLFNTAAGPIAYDDFGPTGAPAVMLIHGFASNRNEGWRRTGWLKAFEQRGDRVIALDLRGHGESLRSHDPADYGHAAMAGDVAALMDHLEAASASVIGFSLGARMALGLALDHPRKVQKLILAGIGERLFEPAREAGALAVAMRAEDPAAIDHPLLRSFRQFADEQGEDRLALAALSEGQGRAFTPEALFAVRAPTLVIVGSRDALAGRAEGLAEAIPGARAETVPVCDHFGLITHGLFKGKAFDFLDGYLDDDFPPFE
jgi:pimeloyl-ACP methyl ester carboxylesterase